MRAHVDVRKEVRKRLKRCSSSQKLFRLRKISSDKIFSKYFRNMLGSVILTDTDRVIQDYLIHMSARGDKKKDKIIKIDTC